MFFKNKIKYFLILKRSCFININLQAILTKISTFLYQLSPFIVAQGLDSMAPGLDFVAQGLDSMALELDLVTLQLGAGGPPSKNRNWFLNKGKE